MLEKRLVIINHFYDNFQDRTKAFFRGRVKYRDIRGIVSNIMKKVNNLNNSFCYKGAYFLPIRLRKKENDLFYFLIKDNGEYLSLVSIYTEDMFLRKCGSKIKH